MKLVIVAVYRYWVDAPLVSGLVNLLKRNLLFRGPSWVCTMTQGKRVEEVENFPTLVEIKNNLPKECFVAELHTSIYYVLRSIFLVLSLGSFAYLFLVEGGKHYIENTILRVNFFSQSRYEETAY